ncbi:hypothetical protein EVAR_33803_1 [Eumeta japonica]|uniref:Uncharacterized protein n=1 Tax=Eumeta variegata TaxID=151549 RepID=A0A4C1VUX5_EUMVA|nr:hypothetical protein EVAR_33803_1 [Eumeta japonica]
MAITIFCTILNISGVNIHVLHSASNTNMMSRYKSLKNLDYALAIPHIQDRKSTETFSRELKGMIDMFLREVGVDPPENPSTSEELSTQPSQNKTPKKSKMPFVPSAER